MYTARGKSSSKTIRIDDEILKIIGEEADKQNMSESAFIEQILRKYVVFDRRYQDYPIVLLTRGTVELFMYKSTNEDLKEIGAKLGTSLPRQLFLMEGVSELNLEIVLWSLEQINAKYSKWFNFYHHRNEAEHVLHLTHHSGEKWSIFISEYIKGMFKTLLDRDISVNLTDSSVTTRFNE